MNPNPNKETPTERNTVFEPKKYRKKPVVIEAMHLTEFNTPEQVAEWCKGNVVTSDRGYETFIEIDTLEGKMIAKVGDYIIKGVKGEFYPCKSDIFQATYEEVL